MDWPSLRTTCHGNALHICWQCTQVFQEGRCCKVEAAFKYLFQSQFSGHSLKKEREREKKVFRALTWQCWWVWDQSYPANPLTSVSPAFLQGWHQQSQEAGPRRWRTGTTWSFWKVQRHTSTEGDRHSRREGQEPPFLFSPHFHCSGDVYGYLWDGQSELSWVRGGKMEDGNMKDRELQKCAPSDELSQADKWFIYNGFASAAPLASTSLSFHFTICDYRDFFSPLLKPHVGVGESRFWIVEHKKKKLPQNRGKHYESARRENTKVLLRNRERM